VSNYICIIENFDAITQPGRRSHSDKESIRSEGKYESCRPGKGHFMCK
jgi:hypothetical protein